MKNTVKRDVTILGGVLLFFPLLIFVRLINNFKKQNEKKDMSGFKKKIAYKNAKIGFDTSEKYLRQDKFEDFYQSLGDTLRNYLADKLNMSTLSITIQDIESKLIGYKVLKEDIDSLVFLLESTDFARFSSGSYDKSKAKKDFKQAKSVVLMLEKKVS